MSEPAKILCVDDRPNNLLALEAVLDDLDICLVKAYSGQQALECVLKQEFALILLDVQMPEMDGFETAELIRSNKRSEFIPIIFVTAISFEDKHVFKGYDTGAVDYLFKPIDSNILRSKVNVFIELFKQREKANNKALELKQANLRIIEQQKALEESEVRFRTAFDQSFQFMVILDENGRVLELNDLTQRVCNSTDKEIMNEYLWEAWAFNSKAEKNELKHCIEKAIKGESTNDESVFYDNQGNMFPILRTVSPVKDEFGVVVHITVQCQDISERKRVEEDKLKLETQLRQAQKMEALGTLAGGIAHDFNNILSVILGYAQLIRRHISDQSQEHKRISKIIDAGNRAKELVRQILGFSRQAEVERVPFKPSLLIKEAIKLLRASIPATIEINLDVNPSCGSIYADPTQIHQILINLCTNAYHAMEYSGGKLNIKLEEVHISESDISKYEDLNPGNYAYLSVKDNGCGIDDETVEKIFDPYFTTKKVGKGTGIGLSIVQGIIKSHKGSVSVESNIGKGTVFHVFFPIVKENTTIEGNDARELAGGQENILVIDDQQEFIEMAKDMIEMLGYHVTVCQDSMNALELFQEDPMQFDLVVTDQTMPGLTGLDLAQKMLKIRPDFPIILCTGYSNELTNETIRDKGLKKMIHKPLVVEDLSDALRRTLDRV